MDLASRRLEVASPRFAEWLADTYTTNSKGICHDSLGEVVELPHSRPGWFSLEDTDAHEFPTKVNERNSLGLWKYWSPNPHDPRIKCGAMRSFMTSSGTCSLDLGIPAVARHAMVMIRECYLVLKPEVVSPLESIWNNYLSITKRREDAEI